MTHAPGVRTVLSPEVSAFLVQFSIYIHQHGSYPANHPVLTSAASATVFRLNTLLLDRETFAVGVAGDRLLIDGVFTDPNHAVLRDLAHQLHRQQLGAVRFWRGVGPHELEDLVEEIAAARRSEKPLGLESELYQQRWAHIKLDGQTYDQLRLAKDGDAGIGFASESGLSETSTPQRLWMALAAAALIGEEAASDPGVDASQVAKAIAQRREDVQYDRVIVEYLLQLGREIPRAPAGEVAPLTARFSELLGALDSETLERLLALGSTLEQRQELVSMVNHELPVNTVVMILQAAANAAGHTMSHTLLRMLNKLALQATADGPQRVRAEADVAVRETVRRLLDDWTLENPNPRIHTGLLDRVAESRAAPARELPQEQAALRIVQMSLEIGVVGGMLRDALNELLDRGEVRTLLELLRESKPSAAVEAIWGHLATPAALEHLLSHDDLEADAVEELIVRLGSKAATPMLDALVIAESRSVRRRLVTWLRRMPDIGPLIVDRLPNAAWYVQRNLLGLLGTLPALPPGFSPLPYCTHTDPRVRREALKLAWNIPDLYNEAVQQAVRDSDPQIVTIGLTIATERLPPGCGSAIIAVARRREWPSEIRVQAIRALGQVKTAQARACLIEMALAKRRWFRAHRLVPRSAELLAAVTVLATTWPEDPAALEVLRLAGQSRDDAVRAAIRIETTP
ncbi:MAG: hypothetical protein ABI836_15415 [Gemmatimonadota bacterium]